MRSTLLSSTLHSALRLGCKVDPAAERDSVLGSKQAAAVRRVHAGPRSLQLLVRLAACV